MGMIVIGVFLGYCLIAVTVISFVPTPKGKVFVFVIFLLIPTWDIIPKRLYFNYLCEFSSGIDVLEQPKYKGYFVPKNHNEFSSFRIKEQVSVFNKDFGLKPELSQWIIRHKVRDLFYDKGISVETSWKPWRDQPREYGKFWVDELGSENCLSIIEKKDLLQWCGTGCARENACLSGVEVEKPESRYTFHSFRRDGKSTEFFFGVKTLSSKILDVVNSNEVAVATTHYYHGGWILPDLLRQSTSCENLTKINLDKILLTTFFDSQEAD